MKQAEQEPAEAHLPSSFNRESEPAPQDPPAPPRPKGWVMGLVILVGLVVGGLILASDPWSGGRLLVTLAVPAVFLVAHYRNEQKEAAAETKALVKSLGKAAPPPPRPVIDLRAIYPAELTQDWPQVMGVVLGWCDLQLSSGQGHPKWRKVWVLWSPDPAVDGNYPMLYRLEKTIGAITCRRDDSERGQTLAAEWNRSFPVGQPPRFAVPLDLTEGVPFFISVCYLDLAKLPGGTADFLNSPDGYFLPLRVDPNPGPEARAVIDTVPEDWVARQRERQLRRLFDGGAQPMYGCIVQANGTLWDETIANDAFCLVLLSFEDIPLKRTFLLRLAESIMYLKGGTFDDPLLQEVAEFVTDERAELYRWRQLPLEFASDYAVYLVDVWVRRDYLPYRAIDSRFLPVLAHPQERQMIEHLPPRRSTAPPEPASAEPARAAAGESDAGAEDDRSSATPAAAEDDDTGLPPTI